MDARRRNCTNEFLPGTSEPEPAGAPGRVASRTGGDALDDQAWVATLPVVEADPEREARRRELLLQVEPAILRRAIGHAPLRRHRELPAARHGRLRGVVRAPAEAAARGAGEPERDRPRRWSTTSPGTTRPGSRASTCPTGGRRCRRSCSVARAPCRKRPSPRQPPPSPAATIATPLAELRARVARLLDRGAARRPDELDLAEAVCALTWPNWGPYRGPVDLELLRRALEGRKLDGRTLAWLDSHEFADACRAGTS